MMEKDKFWRKAYDPGLTDIDPREWEMSYEEAIRLTENVLREIEGLFNS